MSRRLTPLEAMNLAIEEGRRGWGWTRPNPLVGCVILNRNGELLAKGYHKRFGGAHAEIEAFRQVAGGDILAVESLRELETLRGATVVVTLEPCSHVGKTGSCARALARLPIREVIYGLVDPNPLVAGKGLEILRAAGIKVSSLREAVQEAGGASAGATDENELRRTEIALEELCEHFLWNHRRRLPFVALKVATTLDGVMAHASGGSRWITGEEARQEVHRLRAGFAAMMIGKNTFLRDNPFLNVRHPDYSGMENKVIVLDSRGEALPHLRESNLYKVRKPENIYWLVSPRFADDSSAANLGIQVVRGPVEEALPHLYAAGIDSMMVEGGAQVLSYFIERRIAQRMYHFISPQIAGAGAGLAWTAQVKLNWDARIKLRDVRSSFFGDDVLLTGKF